MQRLEVSGAIRLIHKSLGVKGLSLIKEVLGNEMSFLIFCNVWYLTTERRPNESKISRFFPWSYHVMVIGWAVATHMTLGTSNS